MDLTPKLQYMGNGYQRVALSIPRGDYVRDPSCTTCRIYGPENVRFEMFEDGGIVLTILSSEEEVA